MVFSGAALLFVCLSGSLSLVDSEDLVISATALDREFDGIGAVSSGAMSKLLRAYPEKQAGEILDYLFKPKVGASLQILKVEIGGDGQSGQGVEGSHMHTLNDDSCSTGYEVWLIKEARKRNPNLKVYGVPITFPGWVSESGKPYEKADNMNEFIINWINCLRDGPGIDVDYIGIWEGHETNANYLRKFVDEVQSASPDTKIIVVDKDWKIAEILKDDEYLTESIHAIGTYYPATQSTKYAQSLKAQLWAAEDYSTISNTVGSGCLARIINRNYVNGHMTSTLIKSLVTAYSTERPTVGTGLGVATEPWSGHYHFDGQDRIVAHTTWFTDAGWKYLTETMGSGTLKSGGTYVSMTDPKTEQLTIVIETMTPELSKCSTGSSTDAVTAAEYSFKLANFKAVPTILQRWVTQLKSDGKSEYLTKKDDIAVATDGTFKLKVETNQVITLTTVAADHYKEPRGVPASGSLKLPYVTFFDTFNLMEPELLTAHNGYFQIVDDVVANRKLLQQVVPLAPISICEKNPSSPITLMGYDSSMNDVSITTSFMIPESSACESVILAARVKEAGCKLSESAGIYGVVKLNGMEIRDKIDGAALTTAEVKLRKGFWYDVVMTVKGDKISLTVDGKVLLADTKSEGPGFVGLGSGNFAPVYYSWFGIDLPTE